MADSPRTRAEQKFAETQKRFKAVQKEKEKAAEARAEHVAHLKSLRLAKEAEDRKVAEAAAAEKAAGKLKKRVKKA